MEQLNKDNIAGIVQDVLTETKTTLLSILTERTPQVVEAVDSYIANAQTRLTSLLSHLADGGDVRFLLDRLQEEKDILYSEILSFVVIGKGIAQDVINSVQNILLNAIGRALPE